MTVAVLDTNVLVYRYDPRDQRKRQIARTVLNHLAATEEGLLPAQVLAEFSSVVLTRLPTRLSSTDAAEAVGRFRAAFDVIPLTAAVVLEAIRGTASHDMPYYDAQVWAAARLMQAEYLVSEDFAHGRTIDGVTIVNPFVEDGRALLGEVFGVPA